MKISKEHKAKIFGMNIGQKYRYKNEFGLFEPICEFGYHIDSHINMGAYIIKKDVFKITDKHAIEVYNLLHLNSPSEYNHNTEDKIRYGKKAAKSFLQTTGGYLISLGVTLSMSQYINSLGYALPITLADENGKPITYSVEQLVEAGVYKLI